MNWKPRIAWAVLAILTVLAAWLLTRWVTRVRDGVPPLVGVSFDEEHPVALTTQAMQASSMRALRNRIPALVFQGPKDVVIVADPSMRGFTYTQLQSHDVSCAAVEGVFSSVSLLTIADRAGRMRATPIAATDLPHGGAHIAVPPALRSALTAHAGSQAAIRCSLVSSLASAPTFTERQATVDARNGNGVVILDANIDNVDNLRYSGGIAVPFAGDTLRLLTPSNSIVTIEWTDIAAQEQHDIVLVLVGGLAAIAAAMAIEAVRPFIER